MMADSNSKVHPYYAIRDLAIKLSRYPSAHLTDQDLKELNVEVISMNVETGSASDKKEHFCRPFPKDRFERLYGKDSDYSKWELHLNDSYDPQDPEWTWCMTDPYDIAINTEHLLDALLDGVSDHSACQYKRYHFVLLGNTQLEWEN